MGQNLSLAEAMLARITVSNATDPLDAPELLLDAEGPIKVIYAPFDHIETRAKLVIVGITPGLTQAVNALKAALISRNAGTEARLMAAKLTASFSGGAIRNNLVAMLDAIGIARHFNVHSTSEMFRTGSTAVHFTSALRYPVFVDGKNYNGTPDMLATPILRRQIDTHLSEEARALSNAIWLPLGPKADAAVSYLATQGVLDRGRILSGMPHPSGANAERVAVFLGRKRPEEASRRTNPAPLIAAFSRLKTQIAEIERIANLARQAKFPTLGPKSKSRSRTQFVRRPLFWHSTVLGAMGVWLWITLVFPKRTFATNLLIVSRISTLRATRFLRSQKLRMITRINEMVLKKTRLNVGAKRKGFF